ncbi:pyrroloquinoline quinone biosynthesis peptide chaperone PqqD [Actinomadura rupiterrae]|uniref:pyrroloquinoline quinone biosynthesis peptide chaperone PqqD n=1 Tax=Actinomadura rupiterrae TaxID=559627 RepID=UPI0020A5B7A5|nr:pyrroloquinoline quinone biosynthesis peptide chaperone PqqD [Actinomadura rupiterrae]MCP2341057.1 pyrroloquinoline quinone biosynthesis protein D [Actinomadura rupiterrae]
MSGAAEWRPALAASVVLRHDAVRDVDLLVLPERAVVLTPSAAAVLRLCDGETGAAAIVDRLSRDFPDAPVATDVPVFLDRVRQEGWLR